MKESIRLVQLLHPLSGRHVAVVQEPNLIFLARTASVYAFALDALRLQQPIQTMVLERLTNISLDYDKVYENKSGWKILPSFDHPDNPAACLVSGTGLTHKTSAINRQNMHQAGPEKITDSMRMYQWGIDGGQPAPGTAGIQPEWFYKGNANILRGHNETLEIPGYADDGGEEPELAGVYLVDPNGQPCRIGFTTGNEFSDHVMEKKNYLYLAPSKLRNCAIGPELVLTNDFNTMEGTVQVERLQKVLWQQGIVSGEKNMAHSLANLEYHHFKYAAHRMPLQAHVHFFGADAFSFGQGIALQQDDIMQVQWNGMGRPLRNLLTVAKEAPWIAIKSLV